MTRRQKDLAEAESYGSPGTPLFFINGRLVSGAQPFAVFQRVIDEELQGTAGGGAGSFEAWWAEHGSISYFIRDAHSLYLETLSEVGIVGGVLLVAGAALGNGRDEPDGAAEIAARGVNTSCTPPGVGAKLPPRRR